MAETALIFLLAYLFGLAMSVFLQPIFGLYTYVGVFYLHPPSRWWGNELPDLRWSLIAAVVTLLSICIHRHSRKSFSAWHSSTIARVLVLYALWMWLQLLWVESPMHLEGTMLFTKYVLLFYLIYAVVADRYKFVGFCWAHVIGCAYLGWLAYSAPAAGRLEGVGGPGIDDANTLAMHMATGIVFAGFLLLSTKGRLRWLLLLCIPFVLNGIIQTEARGALVGLLFGGIVTIYLKPKAIRRVYYALATLAVVAFLGLANSAYTARMSTFSATFDDNVEWDSSAGSRFQIVESQVRMFLDHPFGAGHAGTEYLSRSYIDERWLSNTGSRASHNTVMSVLVDQGIPGMLLLLILGVSAFRRLRTLKAMDYSGLSETLGLYRTMIGGALAVAIGAGMFSGYLKAEVQIWCLALLSILWQLGLCEIGGITNRSSTSQSRRRDPVTSVVSSSRISSSMSR